MVHIIGLLVSQIQTQHASEIRRKVMKNNCDTCSQKGWVESNGSPENNERLEIQMCQDCYVCESDKQAYELASQEIDTSKYFYAGDRYDYETRILRRS